MAPHSDAGAAVRSGVESASCGQRTLRCRLTGEVCHCGLGAAATCTATAARTAAFSIDASELRRVRPRSFLIRHELIPHTVDGEDVLRLFDVLLDLLAETRDVVVHRAGRGVGVVTPHLIEELVAGDDRAALRD